MYPVAAATQIPEMHGLALCPQPSMSPSLSVSQALNVSPVRTTFHIDTWKPINDCARSRSSTYFLPNVRTTPAKLPTKHCMEKPRRQRHLHPCVQSTVSTAHPSMLDNTPRSLLRLSSAVSAYSNLCEAPLSPDHLYTVAERTIEKHALANATCGQSLFHGPPVFFSA